MASIAGPTNAPRVADMKRAAKVIKQAKRRKVLLPFPRTEDQVQMIIYWDTAWGNLGSRKTVGGIFRALAT